MANFIHSLARPLNECFGVSEFRKSRYIATFTTQKRHRKQKSLVKKWKCIGKYGKIKGSEESKKYSKCQKVKKQPKNQFNFPLPNFSQAFHMHRQL